MKVILLLAIWWGVVAAAPAPAPEIDDWWKTSVFYQIYPRSFKDDDNDGSGDLTGITNKLQYLKDTGIHATWLSPIFKSPMVDAGYDISDFQSINPLFGTMEDFDKLIEKANKLDIKIILDFVPNHSSDEHEWFQKSVKKEGKYTDYYVWADGKTLEDGTHAPPNNWKSLFLGNAWTWNEERQQYYYHQFASKQPDLNYRSEHLVEEMKNVLRFWLDKDVAGFRADAVPFLFESTELLDEPKIDPSMPDDQVEYVNLIHSYTMDLNETFDMIYQMRAVLDEYANRDGMARVMMTEAYTNMENTMKFYGNETHDGASFSFNFFLLSDLNKNSDAQNFVNTIMRWMEAMPSKYTANWVMGNHDNHRTATRHGKGRIDGLNMLIMLLPGVGVTYNGEEIGMEDGYVSWEQTQDPSGLNAGKDHYLEYSRDAERTPFHWDDSLNAGFNGGAETWLPVSDKYKENNLKIQEQNNNSHYAIYKNLLEVRQKETVQKGSVDLKVISKNVFAVYREFGSDCVILIVNLSEEVTEINLDSVLSTSSIPTVLLSSAGHKYNIGDAIVSKSLSLEGNEAIVLEINKN